MPITLSRTERLLLANQFQILAALTPDRKEHFEELAEIARQGFAGCYEEMFEGMHMHEELSPDECRFVEHVLDTFSGLQRSFERLSDKGNLTSDDVAFPGFHHNDELGFIAYATFLQKRVPELRLKQKGSPKTKPETVSEYWPIVERYTRATAAAAQLRRELTAGEIRSILEL